MSTTPAKNKAVTPSTTKANTEAPERTKADARAEAATDSRVTIGLGASGVYGADDAISVADETVAPQDSTQTAP